MADHAYCRASLAAYCQEAGFLTSRMFSVLRLGTPGSNPTFEVYWHKEPANNPRLRTTRRVGYFTGHCAFDAKAKAIDAILERLADRSIPPTLDIFDAEVAAYEGEGR